MPKPPHPIVTVNQTLHRLPLVLEILHELTEGASCEGDDEIKTGCHHAVRTMVTSLREIPDDSAMDAEPPQNEAQLATTWLLGERPRRLLPADLYEELTAQVERHVSQAEGALSAQSDSAS